MLDLMMFMMILHMAVINDNMMQGEGADRVCDDDHESPAAADGRRLCHQLDRSQL